MKYILLVLILALGYSGSKSQITAEMEEYFDDGQYFFNRNDFTEAVYYFKELVKIQPDNANFNFRVGECYLKILGKEHLAIPYFEKAVQHVVRKNVYKRRQINETSAPLHAYFYLGNAYRMNNELNKALEYYYKFLNSPMFVGDYNQNVVVEEIKSCERAKIIQDAPVKLEKEALDTVINTSLDEMNPVVSGDQKTIVFVRKLTFYDAIFYSEKRGNQWITPVNINPQLLSDGDMYPSCLSDEGNILYLIKVQETNSEIYISHKRDGFWTKAVPVNELNSKAQENHISVSADGDEAYISSNRSGSKGGFDIFYSKKDEKTGEWSRPKNCGKTINTKQDEITPVICNNGKTLFFSSKGHYNMGGYDIFYSNQNGKKWQIPLNIGYPINDTRDNYFYQPTIDGKSAYMAIFNYSASDGLRDIFLLKPMSESFVIPKP